MTVVRNDQTEADAVVQRGETFYKVEGDVVPGRFTKLRVEADRDLNEDEAEQLVRLVEYSWVTTARGQEFDPFEADSPNSVVIDADLNRSFSHDPEGRAKEFVDGLNAFIAAGSPERKTKNNTRAVEALPNTKVTVWANEVQQDV
jgi:hypothetical protein